MSSFSKILSGCKAAALALCALAAAHAVAQTGSIQGVVADPGGAVVQGAKLSALAAGQEAPAATAVSDAGGAFQLKNLKPGLYSLQIAAPGFKTASIANVAVAESQSASVAVKLALAPVNTEVRVIDTTAPSGSYNVPVASMGPLGDVSVLDTPYTLNTIPTNLMENQGSRSFSDALKYMPYAQMEARGQMDVGRPQTRGFEGDVITNSRMDGLNIIDTTSYPMEMFDRIEVLSGLAGMYGPQTPAGMFNFILKRPTAKQTAMIDASVDSPTQMLIHGDFGGPITKYFGYRVNALHENGTSYVSISHRRRDLFAAGIDITPFAQTRLELNGSSYVDHFRGFPGMWSYTTWLPTPPDPTKPGYGQPWAGQDLYTRTMSGNLHQGIVQNWHLTIGGLHQAAERRLFNPTNKFTDTLGDFTVADSAYQWNTWFSDSNLAHINGTIKTGKFVHQVVAGTNGYVQRNQQTPSAAITISSSGAGSSLSNPIIFTATFPTLGATYHAMTNYGQDILFADTVSYGSHWIAEFIGSYSWLGARSYLATQALNGLPYYDSGFNPAASLMYKPTSNQTLYFTYATSLYQGATSPSTGVANPNVNLPAYHSKQYEAGYKVQYGDFEATAAAFHMNRPFADTDPADSYYKVIGYQVNDGLDFMVKGKLPEGFNVYGGFTWINPELQNTGVTTTNDKQIIGVPRIQSNFLIEDKIAAVKGLALQVNWHHTGVRAANVTNTFWVPKYDTVDLGARYEEDVKVGQLTWRIAASNIANSFYWASIFPNNINGSSSTGTNAFLGTPRTISASVQFRFAQK